MKRFLIQKLVIAGFIGLFAGSVVSGESHRGNVEKLSAGERKVIVAAAIKALNDFSLTKQKGTEIPKNMWGPEIFRLKPARVTKDWTNVKIVLAETAGSEAGFYVVAPASSYTPTPKRFAELTRLTDPSDNSLGVLYHYRELNSTRP